MPMPRRAANSERQKPGLVAFSWKPPEKIAKFAPDRMQYPKVLSPAKVRNSVTFLASLLGRKGFGRKGALLLFSDGA